MDDLVKRLQYTVQHGIFQAMEDGKYAGLDEALRRIEALEAALRLGIDMRNKQKAYFKDRSKENLIASKQAELEFDRAALGEKQSEQEWD